MTVNRVLAAAAGVLGFLALFATESGPAPQEESVREMSVLDLAWRMRERRPVRVVDVREERAFAEFHLPRAQRVPLRELGAAGWALEDTIVVYDGGEDRAVRAAVILEALGYPAVYRLAGGVTAWLDTIMAPVLPADAPAAARARFEEIAELSIYFGGDPRTGGPVPVGGVADRINAVRRRGCAF